MHTSYSHLALLVLGSCVCVCVRVCVCLRPCLSVILFLSCVCDLFLFLYLLGGSSDDRIAQLSLDSRQGVREVYSSLFTPPIHT